MYDRMLKKQANPTHGDLTKYCGETADLFTTLNRFLTDHFQTTQAIRFPYGKDYGWCITHRKGKKLICDIFAEEDAFTIMLRLSNQQYDDVYKDLQAYAQHIIDHKYPCSNGGWIYYRVLCKEHIDDIETLLSIKCSK